MAKRIITGIDIGSHTIRVVMSEYEQGEGLPKIVGIGRAESRGLRNGYIMSIPDAVKGIRAAVEEAEMTSGAKVREAFLSVGGIGLEGTQLTGAAVISRADLGVTDADVERAKQAAEKNLPQAANKRVLQVIPIEFRIDGKKIYGRPTGMHGMKLEATCLVVTSLEQHLNDMITAVEEAGIVLDNACAAPIAASFVALTKAQKMAGCVLVNIGAETISIVVYEEGIPISLEVFPVGSTNITNDIALGLKVPLEEAELIKLGKTSHQFPKKRLNDIIVSRVNDMFSLVIAHLKKIGKHELLPAGIILTGGGSGIETIEDFARASMHIPSQVAEVKLKFADGFEPHKDKNDSYWYIAYGLTIWGASRGSESPSGERGGWGRLKRSLGDMLAQFMP